MSQAMTEEATPQTAVVDTTDPGRAVSIQEALQRAMEATGGEDEDDDSEPVAAKPEPAKGKKADKAEPEKKDDAPVGVRDLIQERRKLRERFERQSTELRQELQAEATKVEQKAAKFAPLERAAQAIEAGDFDGLAQALGEFVQDDQIKDWNTLVNEALKAHGNPAIREVRKLRAERDRERKEAEEAKKVQAAEQQRAAQAAQERAWQESLTEEITADEDPALPELLNVDDTIPMFVFNAQKRHFEKTGEVLPTKEATEQTIRGIYAQAKRWNDYFAAHADSPLIRKISGDQGTAKKPEIGTAGRSGVRNGMGRKAPPSVSHNRTAEPSAQGRISDAELRRRYARSMEEAAKDDPMFGRR